MMTFNISLMGILPMLNLFHLSSNLLSNAMLWLVAGSVTISFLSSGKKSHFMWFSLFTILMGSFVVNSLLSFYILFELSLIPILLMILFWGNQPERLSAGLYFLIYTAMLSIPYLLIVLNLNISFSFFKDLTAPAPLSLLLMAPFLVKMPVTGLHFWLPKAHVEASTSGSMILAGILLKLGSYGIYRISTLILLPLFSMTSAFWLVLALLASILTFMQSDVKKLVAYSSVTHMTFMMISLSINNKIIFLACLVLSTIHGWVSMGMFFSVGSISTNSNSRLSFLMSSETKFHWFTMLLGLILIMNAALPPFPSFFAELMIITSGMVMNSFIVLFILYSLTVCYYNVYLFMWMQHVKPEESLTNFSSSTEALTLTWLNLISSISLMWLFMI